MKGAGAVHASLAVLALCLGPIRPARAQVLSCQAVFGDRGATVEFARRSREVTRALGEAVTTSDDAVALLERCLESELAASPRAEPCRGSFVRLQEAAGSLAALESELDRLLVVGRKDRTLALFDDTLSKILRDSPRGLSQAPRSLAEVLELQQAGLAPVRRSFATAVEAFRSALPAAENGGLFASIYSGRLALLTRMLDATQQLETYRRFHFETCRATVAATEQVYPAGLQWLAEAGAPTRPLE